MALTLKETSSTIRYGPTGCRERRSARPGVTDHCNRMSFCPLASAQYGFDVI